MNYYSPYKFTCQPGTTRAVIQANSNGSYSLKQKSDYYPFGKRHEPISLENDNKYLYNSKELEDDLINGRKLDWYFYGARFYDPQIGRWHAMDPLMEQYSSLSPYNYVGNNPVNRIDPDGMQMVPQEDKGPYMPAPMTWAETQFWDRQAEWGYKNSYEGHRAGPSGKDCGWGYTYVGNGVYEDGRGNIISWNRVQRWLYSSPESDITTINSSGYRILDVIYSDQGDVSMNFESLDGRAGVNIVSGHGQVFIIGDSYGFSKAQGQGGNWFINYIENTSVERDAATVGAGVLSISTDVNIPGGKPKFQPRGFNPAVEAQVAKGMKVANGVVGIAGRALGVLSIVEHGNQAYQAFDSGNIWQGIGYTTLTGIDIGLVFIRANPTVLAVSVIYGVLDASAF